MEQRSNSRLRGDRRSPIFALGVVIATALASAATTHRSQAYVPPAAIRSYFPAAVSVEVRQLCGSSTAYNAEVVATLDATGLAKLAQVTGQRSLARVDAGGQTLWLRDDGRDGDALAGDGRFTGRSTMDLRGLRDRITLEESLYRAGKFDRVPVWKDRELVGYERRAPISRRDFEACLAVPIKPLPFGPPGPTNLGFEDLTTAVNQTLFIANIPELGLYNTALFDLSRVYIPCSGEGNGDGVWSFGHVMRQMAGGGSAEDFTEAWLKLYTADQTSGATNGFTVEAVGQAQQFIDDWKTAGGGVLNLDKPPFRLMAIVPRVDLRSGPSNPYGGSPHDGGEMRLIFGAVQPLNPCQNMDFSVIVEYGVPMDTCTEIKAWAQAWRALSEIDMWDDPEAYSVALEALTLQITEAGAEPGNPNGSALNQLRSNELDLGSGNAWRIREYHHAGFLEQATTAATPDKKFRNGLPTDFRVFDALISSPLIPGAPLTMIDPTTNSPVPFLGAEALVAFPNGPPAWGSVTELDFSQAALSDQRQRRAMQTCSGCHGGETHTAQAHMFNPANDDVSPFLIGTNDLGGPVSVVDPVAPPGTPGSKTRSFFDLQRRQNDMNAAANQACLISVAAESLANEQVFE